MTPAACAPCPCRNAGKEHGPDCARPLGPRPSFPSTRMTCYQPSGPMRKFLLALLCAGSSFATQAADAIPVDVVFTPDAQQLDGRREGPLTPWLRVERGTLKGHPYAIWEDGVAEVSHWQVNCHVDAMTDTNTCIISLRDFWLRVGRLGVTFVGVGENHYPGTSVYLRIDAAKPIQGKNPGWRGAMATAIYKAAVAGEAVTTRFRRWPEQGWSDDEMKSTGLAEAVEIARWMTKQAGRR